MEVQTTFIISALKKLNMDEDYDPCNDYVLNDRVYCIENKNDNIYIVVHEEEPHADEIEPQKVICDNANYFMTLLDLEILKDKYATAQRIIEQLNK